ncbi:hemagglutinin repeat-containing protein, partial [Bartonella sp. CR84HXZ]|uniref:hemagglutinin repeat-containing protein n=1 Tax=Bartonella sp. CR84HXZ TaxID=1460997 RepID=UPI0035CFB5EB
LAARDFVIKTGELGNSGQLASGQDLVFSVTGNVTNNKTGLIYVKGNGALQVDGTLLNDFGAIMAEGDLSFTNADGSGKSLSLVNKAGFIQAGRNLNIQTNTLKNKADSTPVITEKTEYSDISFQKPKDSDQLSDGMLYQDGPNLWGKGHTKDELTPAPLPNYVRNHYVFHEEKFVFDKKLWSSKEETYGAAISNDGTVYKSFTWKYDKTNSNIERYRWYNRSHMTEEIVAQGFSHKPTVQGMIQSHGNLIINADTIDNHYSIMRAGGNADIHAGVLTNLGATAYKNTFMHCKADTDNCYGYKADGSRDVSLDIADGEFRHIRSESLESVPGLVQAGGTLNLVVDQLHNTAVKGSITGDAHFEAKTVEGNPLEALSGLTGAGALFTPKVDLNNAGELSEGLPLPKPQSGGVGGTLPNQNFIYETRAEFLDVGKFYGSAYYLNRIGYNPDREIFFLGDAYFEKQLIEKQMRDLVGQGLGKGSFIPGSDAIEQVKTLLDVGAEYAKAHNLPFGEALSEEQLASLEAPMVIYVRQQVKGMDVYAPVLYIPEKDRASFVSAGALIMGDDVNITSQNTSNSTITNSGRIAANHQLHVHGGDILSQGGHFAAGGDAVLLAEKNIRLDAGRTTVDGLETVLNTDAFSAGGNATVIAKQDITASGVGISTGGDLAMATEQGNLTIGSAETHYHDEQGDATMHHKSEVNSGGSTTFSSGKDLNILGSDVQATDNLFLQAERNVSIDATRNSMDNQNGSETSHIALHNGSHLSSGKDTTVLSGGDIHIAASDIDAKGNVGLGAQGEIAIGVRNDEMEYHLQGKNTKVDMQASHAVGSSIKSGGDTTIIAGQDGKPHDLTITGSHVAADGKVGLKASNDVLITNAEDSLHYEMSYHKKGGVFSSSKSEHNKVDATQVVGSSITGGEGVAVESGKDTTIIGSVLLAGKGEKTAEDQKQADISIYSGGNVVIKGAQEQFDQQAQSSSSGFLHKKSSDKSESHTTTVSSFLGATGNIDINAQKEAKISASHLLSDQDINVTAENVTIDGMTDHHSSHSETHETGFGVGSGKNFVSIYGSEGKTENEESFEHQGSSLNADGTINITAKKKDVTIVGSDLAGENVNLTAARDVNVLVGHNSHKSNSEEKRSGFGIQFGKSSSSASVGVGVESTKDTGDQWEKTSVQSHITARRDVQITADRDVNMQAADVSADRDVNIDAGNNITLSESYDTSNAKEKHEKSFAGVTGSVNVGILSTIQDIKDAGNLAGSIKDALANMADVSASVTVGFKTEKTEASVQTSTAVTNSIAGGRSINMHAHKGSIHGVGADIIAGTNPVYANDEQSGNITLEAGQHITFESAQNTQSTQNSSESASMNIGYSYGTSGTGWMGNASFGKGKGSSEEVQQKNSHIIGTGTVHTSSGEDTTLAGAVISANHVEMEVGRDLNITSRSDTGQTSSKKNSFSIGFNDGKKNASLGVGVESTKDTGDQWETASIQSHITARRDVQITADRDVNMQAADVSADRDVNIDAGNNITLSESYDTSNAKEKHEKSFAGVTGSVNVGILDTIQDILDTIQDIKDAGKRFGHGDTKHKIGNGIILGLKGKDLYNKGKDLYNGIKSGSTKDSLLKMVDISTSVTVGFKTEKKEKSSQTSTAVTNSIEAGRSVNMKAHKGSIHGVGADIIADTNPVYANDPQSGNINLEAGQHITFESAQNKKSTQKHNQSASMNIGASYGTGGAGVTGSATFSQGEGSSEQVQQKNSHIVGTGTVHTTSGANTTLAGAVVSGERVEMEVGGDFTVVSRSDTGQSSSKKNSVSVGVKGNGKPDGASINVSFQNDQSSSDYHSVVEQSGIKARDDGFEITVKDKTTLTGGIIESTALAEKNSLTTGSISTSDITNSASAKASSDGISIAAGGAMGEYDIAKNIAKNVLDHAEQQDSREGYTKSAISDGTIVITDEAGQKALTGQDVEQATASLDRNTAEAHQGVSQIDVTKLEKTAGEDREMAIQLLEEGFKYSDKAYKKYSEEASKKRNDVAPKKRNAEAPKKRNAEAPKKRNDVAPKKHNDVAPKKHMME